MRRSTPVLLALLLVGCGGGAATTTTAPPTTTAATTTLPPLTNTWFDGLGAGVCFDDVLIGDHFDFSVPAVIVDCNAPHDNEIVALVNLGDGPHPGDVGEVLAAACATEYEAFLGRSIAETLLLPFDIPPDAADWEAGAHHGVCAVYSGDPMIGTAASDSLTAPGEVLAVIVIAGGTQQLFLIEGANGATITDLSEPGSPEPTGPPSWAADASALAVSAPGAAGDSDLYLINPLTGEPLLLVESAGNDESPAIAPFGTVVAFSSDAEGEFDIFMRDFDGDATSRITSGADREVSPHWSPDGSLIAFRGRVDGNSDVYLVDVVTGELTRLTDDPGFDGDPRWSPDGTRIVFTSDRGGSFDVWSMNADGTNQTRLTDHPADDEYPSWSSDGTLVAFQSNRYGFSQIWLMRADGSGQSLLVAGLPSAFPSFGPAGALEAVG